MSLKRIFCHYMIFLWVSLIIYPSYSCFREAHQHEDKQNETKVTMLSVSAKSRSFFSQPDYTYSFPFVDEDDSKILNVLNKVFGSGTHANVTKGTYSISIDYDLPSQSDDIYRQTRYLVSNDNLISDKDPEKSIVKEGYRFFRSHSNYAPEFYKRGGGTYHMENALMTSLKIDSKALLKDMCDEIPPQSKILGVCVKLYSSYDCCNLCRCNVLKHIPNFQDMFDKVIRGSNRFEVNNGVIPFMMHGLMVRYYGLWYKTMIKGKCQDSEKRFSETFNKEKYFTFNGTIDGSISQEMMPVYIYEQPSTEINYNKTISFKTNNPALSGSV